MTQKTYWGEIGKDDQDQDEEYESEEDFEGDEEYAMQEGENEDASSQDGDRIEQLKKQIAEDDGEFAVPHSTLYDFSKKEDNVQPSYEDLKSGASSLISGA